MEVDRRHSEFFFFFSFFSSLKVGLKGRSVSYLHEGQERNVVKRTEAMAQATG